MLRGVLVLCQLKWPAICGCRLTTRYLFNVCLPPKIGGKLQYYFLSRVSIHLCNKAPIVERLPKNAESMCEVQDQMFRVMNSVYWHNCRRTRCTESIVVDLGQRKSTWKIYLSDVPLQGALVFIIISEEILELLCIVFGGLGVSGLVRFPGLIKVRKYKNLDALAMAAWPWCATHLTVQ